jgi:hypothetical protein
LHASRAGLHTNTVGTGSENGGGLGAGSVDGSGGGTGSCSGGGSITDGCGESGALNRIEAAVGVVVLRATVPVEVVVAIAASLPFVRCDGATMLAEAFERRRDGEPAVAELYCPLEGEGWLV